MSFYPLIGLNYPSISIYCLSYNVCTGPVYCINMKEPVVIYFWNISTYKIQRWTQSVGCSWFFPEGTWVMFQIRFLSLLLFFSIRLAILFPAFFFNLILYGCWVMPCINYVNVWILKGQYIFGPRSLSLVSIWSLRFQHEHLNPWGLEIVLNGL